MGSSGSTKLTARPRESLDSEFHDERGPKMTAVAMARCGVLAATGAQAEIICDKDGVLFEGAIRLAVSNAAVCNVLEERLLEEEYEDLKVNQGRPLHLWRINLAVRSGSGRELDYPRADSLEVLSIPNGMGLGQEEGRALFMLAFDGQRPRFREWDIKYSLAREAGATARGVEVRGGSTGHPSAEGQLPPDIQSDVYLHNAYQALRDGDFTNARLAIERLAALQREHGLEPKGEDHYRYAQAWEAAGEPQRAMAAAVRHLRQRGRQAEHYDEALDLINRAELATAAARAGIPQPPSTAETVPVAPPAPQLRAGQSRVLDGMEFAWVPAGEFVMGLTTAEAEDNASPATRVRISRRYWLGRHEETQSEWQAAIGTNRSQFCGCRSCPVEDVSWEDVQEFIERLNATSEGVRYRLPTEAEWEYATREGRSGHRYGANLDTIAWSFRNSGDSTHPVGQKVPNAWGCTTCWGMSGNGCTTGTVLIRATR